VRDVEKKSDKSMGGIRSRLLTAMGDMRPADLARMTGVPPSTLSGYFKLRSIPAEFVVDACVALNISADWLLLGEGPMRRGEIDFSDVPVEQIMAEYNRRLYDMTETLRVLQGTLKNSLFGLAGLFAPWRHRKKRRNMSPYAPFFALCQKAKILRDIRI
jgi:hypothetical protein